MELNIAIPGFGQPFLNYEKAIISQGAKPIVFDTLDGFCASEFDGLIMPGGIDVCPEYYGCKNIACGEMNRKLDEFQRTVLASFIEQKKPVLGICRGHQMINVFFGGTLIQDVPETKKHARDEGCEYDKSHLAKVSGKDSWLYPLYGETFRINSAHHQALDKIGDGLMVDLYSTEDSLVEATHHKTLPIWTVQWHPERCIPSEKLPNVVEGSKVITFFMNKIRENME
ncbi:MAG: gamma-glutamyl-gamma-aminobutyrate hydrolase family protein [Lachnospiraceae bacterium]|nr:gamma-glutamyl-gamma-aminobutyrate hydrolase family protein [Lachnospiraceae bacterium]